MRSQPNHVEVVSFVVAIVLGVANTFSPVVLDPGNYPAGREGGSPDPHHNYISYFDFLVFFFMSPIINIDLRIE